MGKAYLVTKITKIKNRKKYQLIIFSDNIESRDITILQDKYQWWCHRARTDYKRVKININLPFDFKPDYCIIEYITKKPISKEYYWNKLGSLENPSEEEIACYTKIINELLNE